MVRLDPIMIPIDSSIQRKILAARGELENSGTRQPVLDVQTLDLSFEIEALGFAIA